MTNIIKTLLLIALGVSIGAFMIVHLVIGPRVSTETAHNLSVYNLFDHAIPYTFGSAFVTILLLMAYLALAIPRSNKQSS